MVQDRMGWEDRERQRETVIEIQYPIRLGGYMNRIYPRGSSKGYLYSTANRMSKENRSVYISGGSHPSNQPANQPSIYPPIQQSNHLVS